MKQSQIAKSFSPFQEVFLFFFFMDLNFSFLDDEKTRSVISLFGNDRPFCLTKPHFPRNLLSEPRSPAQRNTSKSTGAIQRKQEAQKFQWEIITESNQKKLESTSCLLESIQKRNVARGSQQSFRFPLGQLGGLSGVARCFRSLLP